MEKSAKFERSANYEQRNKTIVKSSTSNPYSSAKEYSYNNNNNNNEYKSKHFEVDVRKKDDEIVPVSKDEEWTKSKKVINHKTRQIETRIQRQIVMEDGKVIADSGPQITQRTKEDVKTEELEASNKKGGKGDDNSLDKFSEGYKALPGESVISEKVETRNTTREARQEQLQYHDESIKELTGYDIHRKALASPNELIQLDEGEIDSDRPRGKLIHYAAKSKKFADREEMKEVSKKQRDGTITTEKTKTHHHEEVDDDELPEDQVNLSSLPEASKETTKEIQYHKDWKDSLNRTASQSKYSVENDKRNDSRSRYSSTERQSDLYEKDRSSQFNRSQEREMSFGRDEKYTNEKTASPRYSPDSLKRQSPIGGMRSTYDKYDANYSVNDRYQSQLNRRDESRYSNRSVASSLKEKPFKEDASVQASFSEDSSDDEAYGRTSSRNKKHETETRSHKIKVESSSLGMSSTDRPKGTYYFGQENKEPRKSYLETSSECATGKKYEATTDHREREELRSMRNEERKTHSSMSRSSSAMERTNNDSVDWFNSLDAQTLMNDLERECRVELPVRDTSNSSTNRRPREDDSANARTTTSGEIKGNVKHEYKSTANGQVISDTSRNEAFQRSFNSPEERKDATRSFNQLMDDTFGKSSRDSMSPLLYDGSIRHIPIERQDSGRQASQSRSSSAARDYNSSNRRLYDSFKTDSPSRSSDYLRYSDKSPSRSSDHLRYSDKSPSRSSDYLRYSDKSPSRSPERRGTFTKSRASPTINRSSPTNTKPNADLWSEFEPYSSESLRKSKHTDYADKNYSTAKDSYSRSYNSSRKTNY